MHAVCLLLILAVANSMMSDTLEEEVLFVEVVV